MPSNSSATWRWPPVQSVMSVGFIQGGVQVVATCATWKPTSGASATWPATLALPPGFGWDSAAHPQLAPAPTRQLQGFPRRVCAASTAVVLYQPPRASDIQPDPTKPCKHEQWCHLFRVWIRQNGDPGSVHHRANSSNNDRSFKDQRISISGVSRRRIRRWPSAFSDVRPIWRRYILDSLLTFFHLPVSVIPSMLCLRPGKSTLIKRLMAQFNNSFGFSVSWPTCDQWWPMWPICDRCDQWVTNMWPIRPIYNQSAHHVTTVLTLWLW